MLERIQNEWKGVWYTSIRFNDAKMREQIIMLFENYVKAKNNFT
jgi:hypothetical protein